MSDPYRGHIDPKHRKSSKTFIAPTKETATTGRFMGAGDDYGVGYRVPVGKEQARSLSSGAIPQKTKCMNPEELHFKD